MISGILVKILSIILLVAVGLVLILGIGTLFKGGETSKKYSNKLMQLRVLLQFFAIIVLYFHNYKIENENYFSSNFFANNNCYQKKIYTLIFLH